MRTSPAKQKKIIRNLIFFSSDKIVFFLKQDDKRHEKSFSFSKKKTTQK